MPLSAQTDPVIRDVLALFSAEEITGFPRIIAATVRPNAVAANAEGYTIPGYPVIYIATWSSAYKDARDGDRLALMKLAGVLAHEAVHVKDGPREAPAYQREIEILHRLGAPSAMVDGVRRAAAAAARAGKA